MPKTYRLILPVVVNINQIDLCMKSLDVPKENLIIIDNSPEMLMKKYEDQGYTVIREIKDGAVVNLGSARSWNVGIKRALMDNPDIIFILCPAEDYISLKEQLIDHLDQASEWGLRTNYLNHCVGFTPKLFEKIGFYDENFYPLYGEDNDFNRRVYLSSLEDGGVDWPFPLLEMKRGKFWGHGMSVKKGVEFNLTAIREYFHKKWGGEKWKPITTYEWKKPFKDKPLDYWPEATIEELRARYGKDVGKFVTCDLPDDVAAIRKKYTDIRDAIPYLYRHACKAKTILELGVREGLSTNALLLGCKKNGGHLWSVDLEPCELAVEKFKKNGLDKYWTFTVMDDLDFVKKLDESFKPDFLFDLIFIDTIHKLWHTQRELMAYSRFLKKDGAILLHDTYAPQCEGIMEAVEQFMFWNPGWIFEEIENHHHGLGKLTRRSD